MKRIALFVSFKVVELSALIFLPYYAIYGLCVWAGKPLPDQSIWVTWIQGFALLFVVVVIVGVMVGMIAQNWEWAGKLTGKKS